MWFRGKDFNFKHAHMTLIKNHSPTLMCKVLKGHNSPAISFYTSGLWEIHAKHFVFISLLICNILTRLTMKIKNKYNNNIFIKTRINKKDKDNNAV